MTKIPHTGLGVAVTLCVYVCMKKNLRNESNQICYKNALESLFDIIMLMNWCKSICVNINEINVSKRAREVKNIPIASEKKHI